MANIQPSSIQAAILGSLESPISEDIYSKNPIEAALPALISIAGSRKEMNGYYSGNTTTAHTVNTIFKNILIRTAYQIYKHHPDIVSKVLNRPFIKKKIKENALTSEDHVLKILSSSIMDINFYINLRKKGYMDWDDGSYETAIIIGYGWKRTLSPKMQLGQPNTTIHFATRCLIHHALQDYPENDLLKFVAQRYRSSWHINSPVQLQKSIGYFQALTASKKDSQAALVMRFLGLSSLIDLGLRYKKANLITTTIKKLENNLIAIEQNQGMLLFAKAWANVYDKKVKTAKDLALQLASKENLFLKQQAAAILYKVNEETQAAKLLQQINSLK